MTTTPPEPPPPTHPGLAHLQAMRPTANPPTDAYYTAAFNAHTAWSRAGYPTDLVPQADLDRVIALYRDALAAEAAAKAEQRLLTARVAACDAEILRLEAENLRLTRGLRGWVRAWLGGGR